MVAILARVPLYLLGLPISLPKASQGMERLLVKKKKKCRQTAKSEDRIVHRSQKQTQACSSLTVTPGNLLGKKHYSSGSGASVRKFKPDDITVTCPFGAVLLKGVIHRWQDGLLIKLAWLCSRNVKNCLK